MDAALNAVMLLIAARLEEARIRPVRMFLAALLGAACALICRRLALSRGETALLWLPVAFIMQAAAQGKTALVQPVRHICLLLCAAGLLGGMVLALRGATESLPTAYALGGICMAVMTLSLTRARRAAADVRHVQIICRYRGLNVTFDAMADSGNTLRDYLTHRPVIVMPLQKGKKLFHLKNETLRPIFADTAGGRVMMQLLMPQETIVLLNGQKKNVCAAVALSDALSENAPALVPSSLIQGLEQIKSRGG